MADLDFGRFDALTFDCYGTLIDWEAGILAGLRAALGPPGDALDDEALLERYAEHEAALEAGPYLRYRDVLAGAVKAIGGELGVSADRGAAAAFAGSVGLWPAFPDSAEALGALAGRFGLGVITNCDDDLFEGSNRRLGSPFRWIVTAQQVGAYKPSHRNFEVAFARLGLPRERILHVAQSLFHDHVPAHDLGLASVWIDRRRGRPGSGATPPASASPAATYADMASFARDALA